MTVEIPVMVLPTRLYLRGIMTYRHWTTLRKGYRAALCFLAAAVLPAAVQAQDWQPIERIEPYAVTGSTPPELYASIGERGPRAGSGRAIAHTNFKLTWQRKYENRDGACVLASARPKLIVTYTLPKPPRTLPASTRKKWDVFVAGVEKHERVHGDQIKDMVRKIEAGTVGLTVPEDPQCRKIRDEMTIRLGALSQEQRRQARDFDRVEMSDGGAVHQLILNFLND